ncbi:MAG: hypothetical protein ACFFCW_30625 [Candidatus Hodarchaeota archaeon]
MTQSESTVFIADDDPSVIKGLCLLMKSVKLNIETYSSAQHLLHSDNSDQPGCLLIDINSQNRLNVSIERFCRENPNVLKGKTPVVFCNFVR